MQLKNGTFCPLIKKDCVGLQCAWFTKVAGYDMNSGKQIEEFQCAVAWLPLLLIENSGQQRQTGAAVESFRNEMVKAQQASQQLFMAVNHSSLTLEEKPKKVARISGGK